VLCQCCLSMNDDNIIPFPFDLREEIKTEMNLAVLKYGPDNLGLTVITESWGETMNDAQVLAALRKLNKTGSVFFTESR
jgi:hypothetical protein